MLAVVLHLQHISSEMSPVSFQVLRSTSWLMAAALDSEQRESWVPNLFLAHAGEGKSELWPGCLAGWSIVLYTKRLWVQFPVRALI